MSSVGIVIPYYRQARYINATLSSIAKQTHHPDKIVLIDDGSPKPFDANKFKDLLPLRVIRHENQGLACSRNCGFALLDTKYVVPLDADDILDKRYLELMLSKAESKNASIVYCDVETFGLEKKIYRQPEYDFKLLFRSNFMVAASLIHNDVWISVRRNNGYGYDPYISSLGGYEDHLFYLEAGAIGYYGIRMPEILFKYRRRKFSMLSKARRNFGQIRLYMEEKIKKLYGIDIGHMDKSGEP